ncbi:MAG: hypothetical protein NT062_30890 [Proteobacteria bacterium]|nr:hypothetical protein [Pseudomonadota bacterium]
MSQPSDDPVEEIVLEVEDLDQVEIVDDAAPLIIDPEHERQARLRRLRWTPGLGVSTKPAIRVGVMLGAKRGSS